MSLTLNSGKNVLRTTLYELAYFHFGDECSIVNKAGPFKVLDGRNKLYSRGICRCCRRKNLEGQKLVLREKIWRRHGEYISMANSTKVTKEYWCGFEKSQINDRHKEFDFCE